MNLGIQWLQTLGSIMWDFDRLQMEFTFHDQQRNLTGISSSGNSLVEGEEFGKLTRTNHQDLIIHLIKPIQLMALTSSVDTFIQNLVEEFSSLFLELKCFPPTHDHDHLIELQPGMTPVSIGPYRYLYF